MVMLMLVEVSGYENQLSSVMVGGVQHAMNFNHYEWMLYRLGEYVLNRVGFIEGVSSFEK